MVHTLPAPVLPTAHEQRAMKKKIKLLGDVE
jgi:hypothetical protein